MSSIAPVPTTFQRYECKYVLTERQARSVSTYLAPYLEPDPHAARRPGGEYQISSLYLDSPDSRLLFETAGGIRSRFKLRIRSYDEDPEGVLFLEVKHRRNQVVVKTRGTLQRVDLAGFLREGLPGSASRSAKDHKAFEDFRGRMQLLSAAPHVVVGYRREAFQGCFDPTARVTFDREILGRAADHAEHLQLPRADWHPVAPEKVVLELKFNGRCPGWMVELIRSKMLGRTSFSKYAKTVEATRGKRTQSHSA